MARPIRVFDGSFGRLQLLEASGGELPQAGTVPQIVAKQAGADLEVLIDGATHRLTREHLLFLNPGVTSHLLLEPGAASAQLIWFQASGDWLRGSFPAVFELGKRTFASASEPITARIRRLADTLVIEVLNDQFLSHERLEFMLQELMLSIVENYRSEERRVGKECRL